MKYSITEHILFDEKYEAFTIHYNRLEELLEKYEMDVTLLQDVVEAVQELGELEADAAFEKGFKKGWLSGQDNSFHGHTKRETVYP